MINYQSTSYIEGRGMLGDDQGGFREGFSTREHIFALHSIVYLYLSHPKVVLCLC